MATGIPLTWLQKFPGVFPGPQKHFSRTICHMPAMFKYKDKQQLTGSGAELRPPAIFSYIQIKSELIFANFSICTCIIVSVSHNTAEKFHDFPGPFTKISRSFQDQTHFPGLSKAWKFYKKKFRTFQEAWEPWCFRCTWCYM